jgi:hypothetical protein
MPSTYWPAEFGLPGQRAAVERAGDGWRDEVLAAVAEAVALTWDPHDHPNPDLLALPVPAATFANGIDADGGQASFLLMGPEDR